MLRKAMFGMMAIVGLIAISTGTASAYGYNGHNHNWNNYHGYRPGAAYGRYAPRVVVNPPLYGNGCRITPGYGYGGYGAGYGAGYGGYGYGTPGVTVNTPGFGFYAR